MRKTDQKYRTHFLEKYGGLSPYNIGLKKRYIIYDEYIWFIKGYVYALLGDPDHLDETSTDHEYFLISYDLFDIVLAMEQNDSVASINDSTTD